MANVSAFSHPQIREDSASFPVDWNELQGPKGAVKVEARHMVCRPHDFKACRANPAHGGINLLAANLYQRAALCDHVLTSNRRALPQTRKPSCWFFFSIQNKRPCEALLDMGFRASLSLQAIALPKASNILEKMAPLFLHRRREVILHQQPESEDHFSIGTKTMLELGTLSQL